MKLRLGALTAAGTDLKPFLLSTTSEQLPDKTFRFFELNRPVMAMLFV